MNINNIAEFRISGLLDLVSVSDFENIDGTMRNGDEIATYYGTDWRAAEISFNFYVLDGS